MVKKKKTAKTDSAELSIKDLDKVAGGSHQIKGYPTLDEAYGTTEDYLYQPAETPDTLREGAVVGDEDRSMPDQPASVVEAGSPGPFIPEHQSERAVADHATPDIKTFVPAGSESHRDQGEYFSESKGVVPVEPIPLMGEAPKDGESEK